MHLRTRHSKNGAARIAALLSLILSISIPLGAQTAQDGDPSAGPWLEREDEYFTYVYKKADEPFLANLSENAEAAYETASGYLGKLPEGKPTIILYGSMDDGTWGGFYSPLRPKIGQAANYARAMNYRSLLTHELTHYLQAESRTGGTLAAAIGFFCPDLDRAYSIFFSDLSMEGSTSFIDGYRMGDRSMMPVRAATLEGRMWDYDKVSSAGLRQPGPLRVYYSGMLTQDWLFERCGSDALRRMLASRDERFMEFESQTFKRFTGIDFEIAWGEIKAGLEKKYAFARDLPRGECLTPRDSLAQPQWGSVTPTARGFFQTRYGIATVPSLGFWKPDESAFSDGKKPRGALERDPGTFIPVLGLSSDDATASADGNAIAAIVNQPAKTALMHAPNANELYVARLSWSADGKTARAISPRKVPGSGYSNPALSPDGKRLFALKRVSDSYFAVELDQETGTARRLAIPEGLSVDSMSVSPDGKRLALTFLRGCSYDVGYYDLAQDAFHAVTDDEAMDFSARFLENGAFVFSSDRENTVAVYQYSDGAFSREILDAVGAFAPASDGRGGYYYSSYNADGRAVYHLASNELKHETIRNFAELRPDWLARRDSIWEIFRAEGRALREKARDDKETPPSAKKYFDAPLPVAWYPTFSFGPEYGHYGLAGYGISNLGESSWAANLAWVPAHGQIEGNAAVTLAFPAFSVNASFGQQYFGTSDGLGNERWSTLRQYGLGASIPIVRRSAPDGTLLTLSFAANGAVRERSDSAMPFSIAESFSLSPNRDYLITGGFASSLSAPVPAMAFLGGTSVAASVEGALIKRGDSAPFAPACVAAARASVLTTLGLRVTLSAAGSWAETGGASVLLPRDVARWEKDGSAPLYAETGLEISTISFGPERTDLFVQNEQQGLCLGARTYFDADSAAQARWIGEVDFSLDFAYKLNFYYTGFLFKIGIGYRAVLDRPSTPTPQDLCLRIAFMDYKLNF